MCWRCGIDYETKKYIKGNVYTLYMAKQCKHENTERLYARGKSWVSTDLYKCLDCNEIFKKQLEKFDTDSRSSTHQGANK